MPPDVGWAPAPNVSCRRRQPAGQLGTDSCGDVDERWLNTMKLFSGGRALWVRAGADCARGDYEDGDENERRRLWARHRMVSPRARARCNRAPVCGRLQRYMQRDDDGGGEGER